MYVETVYGKLHINYTVDEEIFWLQMLNIYRQKNFIVQFIVWPYRSLLKFVEKWGYGGEVFTFRNQFALEFNTRFSTKRSIKPCSQHLLTLGTIFEANFHRVISDCNSWIGTYIINAAHKYENGEDCEEYDFSNHFVRIFLC